MSSPERLKEHKRRKEAQREQRKRNEVLKMKMSFILQQMREKRQVPAPAAEVVPVPIPTPAAEPVVRPLSEVAPVAAEPMEEVVVVVPEAAPVVAAPAPLVAAVVSAAPNRCFKCSKKLGLATTFKCKCDHVFCTSHRWEAATPDAKDGHLCSFDFKAHGRQLLREANPLVKKSCN